ncbi:MAG: DivIVA domain-containing protein, partial [Melioribacteraceae bacterium]|nr:DivIVA domain-containing protein [Melioribacteraceae bacterium]
AFACGWLINKTLGYVHGGKIVFAVVIGTIFISLIMISLMKNYFGTDKLLSENLVLYTLRNVIVGAMGFFGMAVSEVILLGEKLNSELERNRNQENIIKNANKEAELIVKEAEIKASEIVLDANKEAIQVFKDKAIVEQQLSDLVATEKELLNKYIKTVTKPE